MVQNQTEETILILYHLESFRGDEYCSQKQQEDRNLTLFEDKMSDQM